MVFFSKVVVIGLQSYWNKASVVRIFLEQQLIWKNVNEWSQEPLTWKKILFVLKTLVVSIKTVFSTEKAKLQNANETAARWMVVDMFQ